MESQTNNSVATSKERQLTYHTGVIEKIAALSVNEVPTILSMSGGAVSGLSERLGRKDLSKGISAEVGDKQAAIDLSVVIKYGTDIPAAYDEVKEKITRNVRQMTGLEVVEVKMNVTDIDSEGDEKLGYEKEEKENKERELE